MSKKVILKIKVRDDFFNADTEDFFEGEEQDIDEILDDLLDNDDKEKDIDEILDDLLENNDKEKDKPKKPEKRKMTGLELYEQIKKRTKYSTNTFQIIYTCEDYCLALADDSPVVIVLAQRQLINAASYIYYNISFDVKKITLDGESTSVKRTVKDEIDALTNASKFKEYVEEIEGMYKALKSHNAQDTLKSRILLMSINDGFGLTSYLELLSKVYSDLGLYKFSSRDIRPVEITIDVSTDKCDEVLSVANSLGHYNGIVCIDISNYIEGIYTLSFRKLLHNISLLSYKALFVLRLPYIEKSILDNVCEGLSDIINVRLLTIPPFTNEETMQAAKKIFKKYNYNLDESAEKIFMDKIIQEKNDGRYYGVHTIEKVVNESIYLKVLSDDKDNPNVSGDIISASDINQLVKYSPDDDRNGFDLLNELVGMDNVKEQIKDIVLQIKAAIRFGKEAKPCIHMRFVGAPGTGKTTIARILGKILKEQGVLEIGQFYEVGGRDLVGKFIGHTAPKTIEICKNAYGSVLFIDEAYSLYRNKDNGKDFGLEAIDTLIAQMENHRTDMVIIFAGYQDEMELMMSSNPGLASRVPYEIVFSNYDRKTLASIFMRMVDKSKIKYEDSFKFAVEDYFENLSSDIVDSENFGNGRFVRNVYERVMGKAISRCDLLGEEVVFTPEDLNNISLDGLYKNITKKVKKVGF